MKKGLVLLLHLLAVDFLAAQKITLAEALQLGVQNRPELKTQQLEVQLAAGENDKIRAQWLPQISGSVDLRWNTQLQTSVLPIGEFGLPNTPADAVREIQIGRPFNNALSLQADQKLYDANKKIDRQINAAAVEGQQITLAQQEINIRYAITEAYFTALFNRERVLLASQATERAELNLRTAQAQLRDGVALQNDVDRLALDLSNAQLTRKKAGQDLALSFDNLRYQLRLPPEAAVEPAENLDELLKANSRLPLSRTAERVEIKSENNLLEINALNQKKQLARYRPTVSAYGNYTMLQLHDQPNPFATGTWFPFNYIGVRANIPIYDGRQAKLAARDFDLRQQINRSKLERLKADFDFETQSQFYVVQQTQLDLEESRKNIALARQIFESDRFRFEKGVLRQNDLKNTEFSLQTAENNYLNAVYNYLVAQLKYQKASGNL